MYNFRFLINLFSSQRVMRGYGFSVWKCSVDKTFWKNLGVARFWGWVAAGVASVEDSQWLSCTGHSHFQIALHPSQAKDEPITEFGAPSAKMFLWKNGNSRKRRREHGDNVGTEIGGGNLRETAREYQGQRGRWCSRQSIYSQRHRACGRPMPKQRKKAKEHQKEPIYPDLQTLPLLHHWIPCPIESTKRILWPYQAGRWVAWCEVKLGKRSGVFSLNVSMIFFLFLLLFLNTWKSN